ncbi:DMT family transporter [Cupriavidus consociatus]|uniref:DMT family transporter n=1 Tax=Cupriavidus consociatus TaxID=2821357 RepID=UPI001AE90100|nr:MULTISPECIES: DMT family transporter [unclassified Cupriavidus]MBP0621173.1 DMT family transporter [Cupriavidus sp. LEh25]MDK2657843.1 DMT family transporter [Cupriavidus sp. LEh21]
MASASTSKSTPLYAWFSLLLPPLLWAGNFVAGRAVRDDLTPMTLSLGRWVIALLFLLPFAFKAMRRDWRRYWEHRWMVLGTSSMGIAAYNSLLYCSLQTTTASNALLLNSLAPLMIVLLGAVFYRQRLNWNQGTALILSFIGVLILVFQGNWSHWQSISLNAGDVIVLVAAACWAVYTLWLRQLPADLDRLGLMGAQIALALFILLPLTILEHRTATVPELGVKAYAALVYVGVFASALAYFLYMRAVQHFGPARAGLCVHLAPVFGVALSAVFLGEQLHLYHALGIGTIAVGLVFSGRGTGAQRTPNTAPRAYKQAI